MPVNKDLDWFVDDKGELVGYQRKPGDVVGVARTITDPLTGGNNIVVGGSTLQLPAGVSSVGIRRATSLFAIQNNAQGGEVNAAQNTVSTVAAGSTHQFLQSVKVVRRASRFRLWFSNGMPGTANTAFTLAAKVQVPSKNSSGVQQLTVRFNSQPTFAVPAGGGAVWCSDWIGWPVEAGDYLYVKGLLSNAGATFDFPNMGGTYTTPAGCASGDWDSAFTNATADSTAVAKGSGVWASASYMLNMYKMLKVETDCSEATAPITHDSWGDSIGQGANGDVANSWLNQISIAAGTPFQNYCIAGTNQSQIPSRATNRLQLANGDIAVCEHGRNATGNTAALASLWAYLRGLGYRKIIQTTTTDWIGLDSGTLGESSAAMRAYQLSQVGVGSGPNVVWDARSYVQQQVSTSLTGGTLSVSSGSAAVVGVGTAFTDALCGTLLTRTDGTTIGSVLSVTDATNLVLTANANATHTAQAFVAQQWRATQQGAAVTITATKGSTAVTFGGTTGYTASLAGAYLVGTDGGLIGKVTNSTTLAAVANRTYSGSVGIMWSIDGLHLSALGDNSAGAAMVAAGLQNDLLAF